MSSSAASTAANCNRLIGLMLFAGLASTTLATDYSATARVNANTSHNDNLRMTETDKTPVYKYQVAPIFTLNANTETTQLQLASTLYFNRYDESAFNSNDQNIGMSLSHKLENSTFGLNANMVRETTITSEELTTGRVGDKAERTQRYQAAPSWSYTFNETNLIQLTGSYIVQDYRTSGYTGYKRAGGGVDWIHILSERIKLVGSVNYSDFHSDESPEFSVPNGPIPIPVQGGTQVLPTGFFGQQSYSTRTKERQAQLGLDYQWSETTLLQARVGRTRSDTTYPLSDSQDICNNSFRNELIRFDPGYLQAVGGLCNIPESDSVLSNAELDWSWKNERHQVSLRATKSTQPSSNGYVVDTVQLGSSWIFNINELDQISSSISAVRNRTLDKDSALQNSTIANRDYQSATVSYNRKINEHWSATASYQFNKQKYNDIDYQANSKVISLGIRYQPQEWHWAR